MTAEEWAIEATNCDCIACRLAAENAISRAMSEARREALKECRKHASVADFPEAVVEWIDIKLADKEGK